MGRGPGEGGGGVAGLKGEDGREKPRPWERKRTFRF